MTPWENNYVQKSLREIGLGLAERFRTSLDPLHCPEDGISSQPIAALSAHIARVKGEVDERVRALYGVA